MDENRFSRVERINSKSKPLRLRLGVRPRPSSKHLFPAIIWTNNSWFLGEKSTIAWDDGGKRTTCWTAKKSPFSHKHFPSWPCTVDCRGNKPSWITNKMLKLESWKASIFLFFKTPKTSNLFEHSTLQNLTVFMDFLMLHHRFLPTADCNTIA